MYQIMHKRELNSSVTEMEIHAPLVANKAKLGKDPKVQNYPALEDKFMSLLDQYMTARYESRLRGEMGIMYDWHKQLQRILGRDQVLCLMPETEIVF